MKNYLFIFLLLSFQSIAQQQKSARDSAAIMVVINGVYTGENLLVHNPPKDNKAQTYCTDSIFVNGKRYDINLNTSAYEIDLDSIIQIQGTRIQLVIYHNPLCKPVVLTSMSFPPPHCKVEFTSFNIDSTGKVHFTTINGPSGNRPDFIIEQRRGKVWRPVLCVPQKWNTYNTYDTSVLLTAGNNMFNIRETYSRSKSRMTVTTVTVKSTIPKITCKIDSAKTYILFSDSAYYQIETSLREELFNGYAKTVDISFLKKGKYVVFYENEEMIFTIPERRKNKKVSK